MAEEINSGRKVLAGATFIVLSLFIVEAVGIVVVTLTGGPSSYVAALRAPVFVLNFTVGIIVSALIGTLTLLCYSVGEWLLE